MKYFWNTDGSVWAFESDGSQDNLIKEGMIELTTQELDLHLNPPPTRDELIAVESIWRDSEMPIAQQNVTAIQYGEEGIPGTAQQWQKYWLALRKWTADNPDFPDSGKRPVAPS